MHPAVWPWWTWAENWGGGLCPLFGEGELGPHLTQKAPGPSPSSISSGTLMHAAIWPQQIWAENWGAPPPPLWGRGKWVPIYHNVARSKAYLHAKFHLKLIRPTVWPQCTNVADMTVRQTGQNRQRTDSIGQTVLQTVAQKLDSSTCIKFLLMIPKILCALFFEPYDL